MDSDEVAANAACYHPTVSADGRFVAFDSAASNLIFAVGPYGEKISLDYNGKTDVFLRDRVLGTTVKVSGDAGGRLPSLSADGRFVAYQVSGPNGGLWVQDMLNFSSTQVFPAAGNKISWYDNSAGHTLSGDGRFVVFQSSANLPGLPAVNGSTAYVYDMLTQTTTMVSVAPNGQPVPAGVANGVVSDFVAISGDGQTVYWDTDGGAYTSGADANSRDIIARNWRAASPVNQRVTIGNNGNQNSSTGGGAYGGSVSITGQWVAFHSYNTDLVSPDLNLGSYDVFVRDTQSLSTTLASLSSTGQQLNPANGSQYPALSGFGRFVAFESADALVPGDSDNLSNIYVRDRQNNSTVRLSQNTSYNLLDGSSVTTGVEGHRPAIASRGHYVAFESGGSIKGKANSLSYPAGSVNATLWCDNASTVPGESIYVLGSLPELGLWVRPYALKLNPTGNAGTQSWKASIVLPANTQVQWKCVRRADNNPYWLDAGLLWSQTGAGANQNTVSWTAASGNQDLHTSF